MELRTPTIEECMEVVEWRNGVPESLRTPFPVSPDMQRAFFDEVINDIESEHKYFSSYSVEGFVAFGGLTNIDYINGHAEVSLIINPKLYKKGIGRRFVKELLHFAKNRLRLNIIYGECFMCNPAVKFWQKLADNTVILPHRKWWDGKYWDSLYFTFFLEKLDGPPIHEDGN